MTANDPNDLSAEEKKVLKEVAQNFMAAGRLGRLVRAWILGLGSVIGAGAIIWELFKR